MVNPIGGSSYGANIPPSSIDQDIKTFIDDLENFSARIERHESISPEEWEKMYSRFDEMAGKIVEDPSLPNRSQLWDIIGWGSNLFWMAKLTNYLDPTLSGVITNSLGFAIRTMSYAQRNLHSPESSYQIPADLLNQITPLFNKIYMMARGEVKYTRQDVEELYQELFTLKTACESRSDVPDLLHLALEDGCTMLQSLDAAWNMPSMNNFRDKCLQFMAETLVVWVRK